LPEAGKSVEEGGTEKDGWWVEEYRWIGEMASHVLQHSRIDVTDNNCIFQNS
jgi:hypothetical protein